MNSNEIESAIKKRLENENWDLDIANNVLTKRRSEQVKKFSIVSILFLSISILAYSFTPSRNIIANLFISEDDALLSAIGYIDIVALLDD